MSKSEELRALLAFLNDEFDVEVGSYEITGTEDAAEKLRAYFSDREARRAAPEAVREAVETSTDEIVREVTEGFRADVARIMASTPDPLDALLKAAEFAVQEMQSTVGPRDSFNDALDALDRALWPYRDDDDLPALSALPSDAADARAAVSVKEMKLSDGRSDFYVAIRVGDREVTPHVFRERFKAEYEAAVYSWLLNGGEEPCILDFDEATHPNRASKPAPAAGVEKAEAVAKNRHITANPDESWTDALHRSRRRAPSSEPTAWLHERNASNAPEIASVDLSFDQLVDDERAAGWTETPLYAHPPAGTAAEGWRTPDGWRLVPVDPSEEILDAYWRMAGESKEMRPRTHVSARHYWRAMLDAAPHSPRTEEA